MKRYIFKEQELTNEYRYIFLCGSQYKSKSKQDKRNVLRDYLIEKNQLYRPIILEDNFIFQKDSSRYLRYDDIYMKDLYQVEMLTNYLSDYNIIVHESISTGAETGLFLSEKDALNKTCLLVPDETAVEEDKVGQFIRLAFMRKPNVLRVINFYPRVEKHILSNDVMYWHTYFYKNRIGRNLNKELQKFLKTADQTYEIKFTRTMEKVEEGYIHYKRNKQCLEITALPRILLICVAAVFSIDELSKKIFSAEQKELKEYINDIKEFLSKVFKNTIEEKTGEHFEKCSVHARMNVNNVYISGIIGMILYLFQAAGFIEIVKAEDYEKSSKVEIRRKMLVYQEHDQDKTNHFFYEKYSECITCAVDTQIV